MLGTSLVIVVESLGHCTCAQLRERALRRWTEDGHLLGEDCGAKNRAVVIDPEHNMKRKRTVAPSTCM